MALVLIGISIFAGVILASVYNLTKDSISNTLQVKKNDAIRSVLPPFDHISLKPIELKNGVETTNVYKAYDKDNVMVGAAVESTSNNGFRGTVDIMVGFNTKGIVINYVVIQQNETPGLGTQMENWFKTNIAHQDIRGKNPGNSNLNVSKDGGEIDAITGATISSRAFLFAVRNAYFAFTSNLEVQEKGNRAKVDSALNVQTDTLPGGNLKSSQP